MPELMFDDDLDIDVDDIADVDDYTLIVSCSLINFFHIGQSQYSILSFTSSLQADVSEGTRTHAICG